MERPTRTPVPDVVTKPLLSGWLLAAALACGSAYDPLPAQEAQQPPTLTVRGRGVVRAAPDQAVVRLGATVQDPEAAAAQTDVNSIVERAVQAILAQGIQEADVRTAALTLTPVFDHERPGEEQKEPRIVAYQAAITIHVEVGDLARLGPTIDAGVAAGANRIEGIDFGFKDEAEVRRRALAEAGKEAAQKARALSAALGVALESIVEVSEVDGPRPYRSQEARLAVSRDAEAATPIQPGRIEVEAEVQVRWRISASRPREG